MAHAATARRPRRQLRRTRRQPPGRGDSPPAAASALTPRRRGSAATSALTGAAAGDRASPARRQPAQFLLNGAEVRLVRSRRPGAQQAPDLRLGDRIGATAKALTASSGRGSDLGGRIDVKHELNGGTRRSDGQEPVFASVRRAGARRGRGARRWRGAATPAGRCPAPRGPYHPRPPRARGQSRARHLRNSGCYRPSGGVPETPAGRPHRNMLL